MINYLPYSLRDVREFVVLCEANQPDKDEMKSEIETSTDDFYITSATDKGISRWEKVMGITPPADATKDERLFNLMMRVNNRVPYSERRIKGILDNVVGANQYDFIMTLSTFKLEVKVNLSSKYKMETVKKLLNATVPAHIQLIVTLKYNSYATLSSYTHEALASYTHNQLKEEIITE